MSGFEPLDFLEFSRLHEAFGIHWFALCHQRFISCLKSLRLCSTIHCFGWISGPIPLQPAKDLHSPSQTHGEGQKKTFSYFDAKLLAGLWLVERTTYKGSYFILHPLEISVFLHRTHPQHHVVLIFDNPPLLRECCSCSFSSFVSRA